MFQHRREQICYKTMHENGVCIYCAHPLLGLEILLR